MAPRIVPCRLWLTVGRLRFRQLAASTRTPTSWPPSNCATNSLDCGRFQRPKSRPTAARTAAATTTTTTTTALRARPSLSIRLRCRSLGSLSQLCGQNRDSRPDRQLLWTQKCQCVQAGDALELGSTGPALVFRMAQLIRQISRRSLVLRAESRVGVGSGSRTEPGAEQTGGRVITSLVRPLPFVLQLVAASAAAAAHALIRPLGSLKFDTLNLSACDMGARRGSRFRQLWHARGRSICSPKIERFLASYPMPFLTLAALAYRI